MKLRPFLFFVLSLLAAAAVRAEPSAAEQQAQQHAVDTAAAAAVATGRAAPRPPDFLEHIVDSVLELFDVRTSENTVTHYVIAALFLVGALLLRRALTNVVFKFLRRLAAKTETTLDDKLFPAMEDPAATLVMVTGIFSALKVLKLSATADNAVGYGSTVAFSLVFFWGLLRAFNAVLDHLHEIAVEKQLGVAAFMPWIKKSLVAVFMVFGVLLTIQSLGYNVSTILQGLGIGGLAFALAAQDTIANLFGSIVVAMDQPFKVGEAVKIGAHAGTVEDIGLRSTKIRLADRSLVILPNKLVSSEAIVNLSRFTGSRVEQVFSLTYDTTPDQLEAIVREIRRLIEGEAGVEAASVQVYFRDFSASSLDLWAAYLIKDPDFAKHLAVRQRLNLAIMRAVETHGLDFAYPTSVLHLDGPVAKQIAGQK
ncbi:MAG: mechanosensitive ion channel family protein [Opitutae bacterium]|nr:mechanosensitive ion channel family protein [Opitutae bacterium]